MAQVWAVASTCCKPTVKVGNKSDGTASAGKGGSHCISIESSMPNTTVPSR